MPFSITVAMPSATRSGRITNGRGTWWFGKPSVCTNPGFTAVTSTPYWLKDA